MVGKVVVRDNITGYPVGENVSKIFAVSESATIVANDAFYVMNKSGNSENIR